MSAPRDVARWDAFYARRTPPPWDTGAAESHLVAWWHSIAPEARPRRVIELGAGLAHSTEFMARTGATRADAVDISPTVIECVRKRIGDALENVRVLCLDLLGQLEGGSWVGQLPEAGYDLVFDCQCFHVLRQADEHRLADTIVRLLAPGGYYFQCECGFPALAPPSRAAQAVRKRR